MKKLTFEAACKKTGNDPNKLPNVEGLPEIQAKRIIADHILSIMHKATNGKWKADFSDASQIKWTGWLRWVPSRSAFGDDGSRGRGHVPRCPLLVRNRTKSL